MANFSLTFQQISGGSDSAPLVGVSDWYEYQEGKRAKRLGSRYTVLLLADGCSQLSVKVEDEAPVITQEELDKHNTTTTFIFARFHNFKATVYPSDHQIKLSAKADRIELVKDGAAK